MGRLEGKVILITGAARGQGEVEARLCALEGATVYLADVLDSAGEALAGKIRATGGAATYLHLDVAAEADWHAAAELLSTAGGALHGLVNNAAVAHRHTLFDTTAADWEKVHRVNLLGPFLGIKTLAPLLGRAQTASVVNIGSAAGMTGNFATAYAASKWGLRGLTKSASLILAERGIRVNAIHPGLVTTPLVAGDPPFVDAMVRLTPVGRAATAEDIAGVVLFLLSDDSRYMTGVDLEVDGGLVNGGVYHHIWKAARAPSSP